MKYVLQNCKKCDKELERLEKETRHQAIPIVLRLWCSEKSKMGEKSFCIETFRESKQLDNLKIKGALEELERQRKVLNEIILQEKIAMKIFIKNIEMKQFHKNNIGCEKALLKGVKIRIKELKERMKGKS